VFCSSGAFLIPYFLFVIIGGIPLFYLEVAVGQFMAKGGVKAWAICPVFQGWYRSCYTYNLDSTLHVFAAMSRHT